MKRLCGGRVAYVGPPSAEKVVRLPESEYEQPRLAGSARGDA
jgi:hypothetical protein